MLVKTSRLFLIHLILPLSWASLLRDVELQHHVLTTTRQSSLLDCSAACLVDTCCLSFNFFQPTLECQLNFRTKEQNPFDFVPKKGSFYRNKDDITSTLAGVCGVDSCLSYEVCHVSPVTKEPECQSRDLDVNSTLRITSSVGLPIVTHNCDDVMFFHPCTDVYTLTALDVYDVSVFCDMATDNGGWLVIQRRMEGLVDFYRNWTEYKDGFGDVSREFWLGNELIHQITNRADYELRVDLEDFEGNTRYAMYQSFSLASEAEYYKLHIGNYSGNAGDSLSPHDGYPFSTKDVDLDSYINGNCASHFHGAWWYHRCYHSNLNGNYFGSYLGSYFGSYIGSYLGGYRRAHQRGVAWTTWKGSYYSLKKTEMKIRQLLS